MSSGGIPDEFAALWSELRPELLRQVVLVEQGVAALAAGTLDDGGRELARGEAHKLAGSVGAFGFDAAGRAARELELRFKAGPAAGEAVELAALVRLLRAQLDPPAAPASPPSLAAGAPPADAPADAIEAAVDALLAPGRATAVDVAIVEDDEVLAQLALHALGRRGYSTVWIADGAEALRRLGGERPELRAGLVLLDWDLPGRDGLDVLRELAAQGVLASTRVVMVTGHVSDDAVSAALTLGAHEHVAKPYTIGTLTLVVSTQLGRRAAG